MTMTTWRILLFLAITGLLLEESVAFVVAPSSSSSQKTDRQSVLQIMAKPSFTSTVLAVSRKDDDDKSINMPPLSLETSFGADAVPESQRPVNEFLDVTNQPMFGWASLERGNKGLLTRLVILYSVFFGVV